MILGDMAVIGLFLLLFTALLRLLIWEDGRLGDVK